MLNYGDPVVLKQLFLHVHSKLHRTHKVVVYQSERANFVSAFARAAIDMQLFASTRNRGDLINGVARLAVAVAAVYAEGKATAFVLTDALLSEAGFQLPRDDYHSTRLNFEVLVQTKRVSEVIELLDRHWH